MHLILDKYGTHKTPRIRAWFAKRPRYHLHFTPTYGAWLNLVERWFAELTTKQIRRGAHRRVSELERTIREFLEFTILIPNPLPGPKALIRFWPASPVLHNARRTPKPHNLCHEPLLQDTSSSLKQERKIKSTCAP